MSDPSALTGPTPGLRTYNMAEAPASSPTAGTLPDPSHLPATPNAGAVFPDMGRARFARPVDIDWLFPDPDRDLPVVLRAFTLSGPHPAPARQRHWSLAWRVASTTDGVAVWRTLEVVQEIGSTHHTNWGAYTKTDGPVSAIDRVLAELGLAQRRALEEIASRTPVLYPNGIWNCQDWIMAVLDEAVKAGLFAPSRRDEVIVEARSEY